MVNAIILQREKRIEFTRGKRLDRFELWGVQIRHRAKYARYCFRFAGIDPPKPAACALASHDCCVQEVMLYVRRAEISGIARPPSDLIAALQAARTDEIVRIRRSRAAAQPLQ